MPESITPLFYSFADFEVDVERRLLLRGGESVTLTPKVFDTLLIFLEHAGEVLEKGTLMNLLWADSFVEESNLAQNVAVLRKALGEEPKQHKYILTIPGRGYRFVAKVDVKIPDAVTINQNVMPGERTFDKQEAAAIFAEDRPVLPTPSNFKWVIAAAFIVLAGIALVSIYYLSGIGVQHAPEIVRNTQITNWSGIDFYPSISPDGNSVAFSSDRTGNFEIYLRQFVVGAREVPLTNDGGQNFQPAFSPEGTLIAYHSKKKNGIWIIPVTGGSPRQISETGSRPSWSPDGTQIAFQTDGINDVGAHSRNALSPSTIWTVPASGGPPRPLTKPGEPAGGHGGPAWSPDGSKIVFNVNDWSTSKIWTMSSDGTNLKPLYDGPYVGTDAIFSADGHSILYSGGLGEAIVKIEITADGDAKSKPEKIIEGNSGMLRQISRDSSGKRLVYSSLVTNSNIWANRIDPAGKPAAPSQLTQNAFTRNIAPSFSPDGTKLAFASYTSGSNAFIWVMDADGKNPVPVTRERGVNPWWFPDGKHIGYTSTQTTNSPAFTSVTLDGGMEKKLAELGDENTVARPSPDGRKLAFNSKKGSGVNNVWIADIDGSNQRELTFDKEMAAFPCWSPDGRWLAFQLKRGDDTHIAIMPSEGGDIIQLTDQPGQSWSYDWTPDSDKIIFAGERESIWNVYLVSRTTKKITQLTNFTKLNSYVRYPAWSPKNDQFVYEYSETTGNVRLVEFK